MSLLRNVRNYSETIFLIAIASPTFFRQIPDSIFLLLAYAKNLPLFLPKLLKNVLIKPGIHSMLVYHRDSSIRRYLSLPLSLLKYYDLGS